MDRNAGGEAGDAPRSLPTPFLTKTYQLVDDHAVDEIISWNEDGSAFIVWNPTEFARDLLPKYFKHNNFSSFVRQLNTYGFRKVVPDRWEFSNDCFRRDEKNLLSDIQRRKVAVPTPSAVIPVQAAPPVLPTTVSPSDSSEEQVISSSNSPAAAAREFSGTTVELIGENDRLRKENVQLNKELSQMKSMCNNIYDLMTNYASNKKSPSSSGSDDAHARSCNPQSAENALKLLDLLPMTKFSEEIRTVIAPLTSCDDESIRSAAEEISTRLFGVPICQKRGRDGEGSSMEETELQLQQPEGNVKSEPMDEDNVGDDQRSPWVTRSSSSRNQRVCNGGD